MYVISSRPSRIDKGWIVLQSGNGQPPVQTPAIQPNYLPDEMVKTLSNPLLILIHGYANREPAAFAQYWKMIGTSDQPGLFYQSGFTGSIVGYDWPSFEGTSPTMLGGYATDRNNALNVGASMLASFLDQLTTALPKGVQINLMAHSMGNLVMCQALSLNPSLAERLDNIISFAADVPYGELERPEMKTAADALAGKWFVYWAQADFVLMTASNYANMLVADEQWGDQRLGQAGAARHELDKHQSRAAGVGCATGRATRHFVQQRFRRMAIERRYSLFVLDEYSIFG